LGRALRASERSRRDIDWKNKLYFGDNLKSLRDFVTTESLDLIYLDPPLNSTATGLL